MNRLDNHTSARFYNAQTEHTISTDLTNLGKANYSEVNDITKEQRLNWKKQRQFRFKRMELAVLVFEVAFVAACAYFILRSVL